MSMELGYFAMYNDDSKKNCDGHGTNRPTWQKSNTLTW